MSLLSLQFLMFGIGKDEEPSDKFYLVEEFVTTFLLQEGGQQDPKNRERNAFVLSVLLDHRPVAALAMLLAAVLL